MIPNERRRVLVLLRPAVQMRGGRSGAGDHRLEPASVEHPLELVGEQQQRRDRRRVVRLLLDRVLERDRQREKLGDPATVRTRGKLPHALARGGAQKREPESAVGAEALLRREVVGVGLSDVDGQAGRGRCPIDQHQCVIGVRRPRHRDHDAGRRLVVGPGDHIGLWVRPWLGRVAGLGLNHDGVGEERGAPGARGELGGELPVGQVQRALTDQAAGGGVPERSRPAVAEHDLVVGRKREQLAQVRADLPDHAPDRRLAVRGSHDRRALLRQPGQLFPPNPRRS